MGKKSEKKFDLSASFSRRKFINVTSASAGWILASGMSPAFSSEKGKLFNPVPSAINDADMSIIGNCGSWYAEKLDSAIPKYSYRRKEYSNLSKWKKMAKKRLEECLAIPDLGSVPEVKLKKKYSYDGLDIEEISWQLPYGRPTDAVLLKPVGSTGPLPAILAFHDHGGKKYFGTRKIVRTADDRHPLIAAHQKYYYDDRAWANEIAKRGYIVLVSDAFPFASRRVMLQDVPEALRKGLDDNNPEDADNIIAYNRWAAEHESVMAKSLFSAGTTWPGVFFAEDKVALDVLCSRTDVDQGRIGCAGLSGGGMRTVFMAGLEPRIKCAVCIGFMTTWKDLVMSKSFTHTWMTFAPLVPNDMDFPEILGLRVPVPVFVQNAINDGLYTLDGMKKADEILEEVYKKAGASDNYKCTFYPGPHRFNIQMQEEAFDWFDKWLKN